MAALEKVKGKVETVLYQGWGEPLLYPDLPKLLEAAHMIGAKTSICTNGTIFRKEVFDKCNDVTISIDSLRPDYRARRGANLIKVKENILKLRKNYPYLPIMLSTVVSKENVNELEEIIDFARKAKSKVKFQLQVGEALPPVDKHEIQKMKSFVSAHPGIAARLKLEKLLLDKEHPKLRNSLYVDVHGQISIPYHEREIHLGEIGELDKIIDQRIKRSSQLKPNGHL